MTSTAAVELENVTTKGAPKPARDPLALAVAVVGLVLAAVALGLSVASTDKYQSSGGAQCEDPAEPPAWTSALAGKYTATGKALYSGTSAAVSLLQGQAEFGATENPLLFTLTRYHPCYSADQPGCLGAVGIVSEGTTACVATYACKWSVICVDNDDVGLTTYAPYEFDAAGAVTKIRGSYTETGPTHVLNGGAANPAQAAVVAAWIYERPATT